MRERVLRPLGLTSARTLHTHFDAWTAAIPYEQDGAPIPPYLVDEKGARDLVMTALDLAKFGQAHVSGVAAVTDRMLSDKNELVVEGVDRWSYGLGWMIQEDSPAALFNYGHTGEGPGASSSLTIVPSEDLVVATIANTRGAPAYRLNEAIVDAMSPTFAARRRAHPYQEEPAASGDLAPFLGRWVGSVEMLEGAQSVELRISAERAEMRLGDQLQVLTGVGVANGALSARSTLQLASAEAGSWPHQLRVSLSAQGARLAGTIAAYASRGPAPHDQFWLSYNASLQPQA